VTTLLFSYVLYFIVLIYNHNVLTVIILYHTLLPLFYQSLGRLLTPLSFLAQM